MTTTASTTAQHATTPTRLTYGMPVKFDRGPGRPAGYATVFTIAGFCKKNGINPSTLSTAQRNEPPCLNGAAVCIDANGTGMREWNDAPTLSAGDTVELEGEHYRVEPAGPYDGDSRRLTKTP